MFTFMFSGILIMFMLSFVINFFFIFLIIIWVGELTPNWFSGCSVPALLS